MKPVLLLLGVFVSIGACAADVLHLYNWSNYLSDEVAQRFEVYCACRLVQDYYGDNQEMLSRLASDASGIDVVVPSGYAVAALISQGVVQKLDRAQLSNFGNLDPQYLGGSPDPANHYSVPYGVTTTLVGFNQERLRKLGLLDKVNSWAIIFDPAVLSRLRGRVTVLDSPRELMAAALMYLGRPANSTRQADWLAARDVITRARPYWQGFSNQSYIQGLSLGLVDVALGYSSDMVQARQEMVRAGKGDIIGYALQREGNTVSLDSLVILKSAPRKDLAYRFINFLLMGRNAAALSNDMGSGNPNRAALKYIRQDLVRDTVIFPSALQARHLQQLQDLNVIERGEMARIWAQIKLS